jgi:hypothetical protein
MNYEVLLLITLIYIIPILLIYRKFVRDNERADEEYRKWLDKNNPGK